VDDDENILSAFREFLKGEGYFPKTTGNVQEALHELERKNVKVLITDVRLNHDSGVTFLLQVKALYPTLPVIVVTGYPDLISEQDVKAYGADVFLLKPLDLKKLREALALCL